MKNLYVYLLMSYVDKTQIFKWFKPIDGEDGKKKN